MDEGSKGGTEYRYHLMDDLSGKVVGAFIQDPRRSLNSQHKKNINFIKCGNIVAYYSAIKKNLLQIFFSFLKSHLTEMLQLYVFKKIKTVL